MSKLFRTMGGFLLTLALLLSMGVSAFAAENAVDPDRTGSISITPKETGGSHTVVKGTSFTLYYAAEVTNDGSGLAYTLTDEFKGSGADLSDLEAGDLAKKLADYAGQESLSGTLGEADENGTVTFTDLPVGLYLLVQTGVVNGSGASDPFLVSLPMAGTDGASWIYDVDASPKTEIYELTDVTVKKVWNDGGNEAARPSSVTINLYRDSTLIDTVELTADGGWTYTWTGLEKSDGYSVSEESVAGYAASCSRSGYTFTVTNTGGGVGASGGSSPKTPTLVQTGQLNWPVPLLAGCGLALFALGWGMAFLKRKQDA